jgi:hypothetical protein
MVCQYLAGPLSIHAGLAKIWHSSKPKVKYSCRELEWTTCVATRNVVNSAVNSRGEIGLQEPETGAITHVAAEKSLSSRTDWRLPIIANNGGTLEGRPPSLKSKVLDS